MPSQNYLHEGRRSIAIILPVEQVIAVDRLRLFRPGRSRSAVISDAIEHYLQSLEQSPAPDQGDGAE